MPELIAGQIAWVGCWAHYTDPHMGSKQCDHNHYRDWELELATGNGTSRKYYYGILHVESS